MRSYEKAKKQASLSTTSLPTRETFDAPLALSGSGTRSLTVSGKLAGRIQEGFGLNAAELRFQESSAVEGMGMEAAAQGNTVSFAPGRFRPDTAEGLETLGHELWHVREQAAGGVRANVPGLNLNYEPGSEAASDAAGREFAAGGLAASGPVHVGGNSESAPVQGKFHIPGFLKTLFRKLTGGRGTAAPEQAETASAAMEEPEAVGTAPDASEEAVPDAPRSEFVDVSHSLTRQEKFYEARAEHRHLADERSRILREVAASNNMPFYQVPDKIGKAWNPTQRAAVNYVKGGTNNDPTRDVPQQYRNATMMAEHYVPGEINAINRFGKMYAGPLRQHEELRQQVLRDRSYAETLKNQYALYQQYVYMILAQRPDREMLLQMAEGIRAQESAADVQQRTLQFTAKYNQLKNAAIDVQSTNLPMAEKLIQQVKLTQAGHSQKMRDIQDSNSLQHTQNHMYLQALSQSAPAVSGAQDGPEAQSAIAMQLAQYMKQANYCMQQHLKVKRKADAYEKKYHADSQNLLRLKARMSTEN